MPNTASYSDDELFVLIAAGDEQGFRTLYTRYQRRLQPFLFELTRSQDIASDLVQETMLRIWLYRDKLAEVENPKAYIYRIAANRAHTWLKKHIAEKESVSQQVLNETSPDSAETSFVIKAITEIVQRAIQELPEQRQRIFRLSREQGMSAKAIADSMNISVSTVKNSLLKATKYIREQLQKTDYLIPATLLLFLL